jgi:hypothetical protein
MSNIISIIVVVLVFIVVPFWLVYKLDGGFKLFAIAFSVISAGVFVVILVSVNEIEIALLVLAFALLGYGILAVQSLKRRRAGNLRPGHRLDKLQNQTADGLLKQGVDEQFPVYKDRILRTAGWFPERHVLSTLELSDGFDLLEPAKMVLDEFGGLSVKYVYTAVSTKSIIKHDQIASIVIDPIFCAEGFDKEYISYRSQEIGRPFYPLGVYLDDWWDPEFSTILIDDLGRLFLRAFWMSTFLGETFDVALDNLLTGEKGKSIDRHGQW